MRFEYKYLISIGDYELTRLRLSQLFLRDENANDSGEYTVRSLYFDDYFNNAYHDKYMGKEKRRKYRIRIYNRSRDLILLEKKSKWNDSIEKIAVKLNSNEVESILGGDYGFLLNRDAPMLREFFYECTSKLLRPRVIVEYEREPFVSRAGDVRITFDKNLRACAGGVDIFDFQLPEINLLPDQLMVMEVKYSGFLGNVVREMLSTGMGSRLSVSKFVLGCDKIIYRRVSSY